MKILWRYLKPFRGLVLLTLALAGAAQLLALIDPVIFGKIIDEYALNSLHKPEKELVSGALFWLAVAVGVAMAARLARAFQDYVLRLVVQKFGMRIFNDGMKQTLRLSYQEFEEQRSGETVSTLQRTRRDTEMFINAFINVLFASIVGFVFLIWYAVTKHWALVPVFAVGVLLLGGMTGLLSRRIKTVQRSIFRENAKMSGIITESLRNIELVKSLGLVKAEVVRFRGLTENIFGLEMDKVRRVRTLSFFQGTTINILKQSILFILLWLIFRKVLSPGELISMQFITTTIFGPLQELGNIIVSYREAEASIRNFDALMKKPIEYRPEEPVDVGPIDRLEFQNVVFRHKTAAENAIDGISFSARLGDSIAFVGPSGSGKSTLVKLLVGLYRPREGDILFDGTSVRDIRYNLIRRQIGFVTQETQLFAGTIRDNLLFIKPDATDGEMLAALDKASFGAVLARTDKGLDTILGEGGTKLSGGEKQRLSIARALIRNPRLLIFDEATSSLDSLAEEEITETVARIAAEQQRIIISIAHRLSTIMNADRIFVLEKGRIVETGTHRELVDLKGLYYAMWRQQIGERKTAAPGRETDEGPDGGPEAVPGAAAETANGSADGNADAIS
ncbi:MAG: ABC transporter ATP-binding protein [Acidobacteriota bacterium]|nr:ABC transporter ATP-binding protein [Acidobacteriota bacterium]HOF83185.1 ABC transporter ATP-binding protein [Candidatus Aminicenantes bacterium]HPO44616.1 ABC transporter ATP-binding protein [Spirochaetota bacterium]MDD8010954.1 ABC transporter ATP-binding protein [Acidobacteriota bacterium]MDD8029645.1 ABC transporter ATP-binding protein [Acidobacteriota bacterium]